MSLGLSSCNWSYLTQHEAETRPDHSDPSLRTKTYVLPYETCFTTLLDLLNHLPRWRVVRHDLQTGEITAERQTRTFHFIDDVQIRIIKTGQDTSTIHLRSVSRVGKGDFGQNARNIREVLEGLDRRIDDILTAPLFSRDSFSSDRLSSHVHTLSAEIGERHFARPTAFEQAADYIAAQFQQAGFETQFESFEIKDPPLLTELRANREEKNTLKNLQYKNVIAIKKGEKEEIIVVGAHYDTVIGSPGADDNASGVAVLLESARLLRHIPLKKTLLFAAFANEEAPFFRTSAMGSAQFLKMHPRALISFMISLEMLGYFSDTPGSQGYPPLLKYFYPDRANFIAVVGNLGSKRFVNTVAETFREKTSIPVEALSAPRMIPGVDFSDQLNFWKAGIPAVMLTDTAFNRNPHYHTAFDLPQTLNYEKMAEVTKGVVATLLRMGR